MDLADIGRQADLGRRGVASQPGREKAEAGFRLAQAMCDGGRLQRIELGSLVSRARLARGSPPPTDGCPAGSARRAVT